MRKWIPRTAASPTQVEASVITWSNLIFKLPWKQFWAIYQMFRSLTCPSLSPHWLHLSHQPKASVSEGLRLKLNNQLSFSRIAFCTFNSQSDTKLETDSESYYNGLLCELLSSKLSQTNSQNSCNRRDPIDTMLVCALDLVLQSSQSYWQSSWKMNTEKKIFEKQT